jgi:hypothetical protein
LCWSSKSQGEAARVWWTENQIVCLGPRISVEDEGADVTEVRQESSVEAYGGSVPREGGVRVLIRAVYTDIGAHRRHSPRILSERLPTIFLGVGERFP